MNQFHFSGMVQDTSKHIYTYMQLTNPLETENIVQEKLNKAVEEQNSINNKKKTKESASSSDEDNDAIRQFYKKVN